MSNSLLSLLLSHGTVAICRRIYGAPLFSLAESLLEGGVCFLEVTFDHTDPAGPDKTCEAIRAVRERFPALHCGAGTVLTPSQVEAAHDAGAAFIISPNTDAAVIGRTKALGLLSIPGAMTPSEIAAAAAAGADVVKLFPASELGVSYVKAVRAPLGHIPLLATGGVTAENYGAFLDAGCAGAGVGGPLCRRELIEAGRWDELTALARRFTDVFAARRRV